MEIINFVLNVRCIFRLLFTIQYAVQCSHLSAYREHFNTKLFRLVWCCCCCWIWWKAIWCEPCATQRQTFLCANCLSSHDISTCYAACCMCVVDGNRAVLRLDRKLVYKSTKYITGMFFYAFDIWWFGLWVVRCTLSSRSVPNKSFGLVRSLYSSNTTHSQPRWNSEILR